MLDDVQLLRDCTGFQWDGGNAEKHWLKHRVTTSECEQVFFNRPLAVGNDEKHSLLEKRYHALGQTDAGRLLFVVFAIRRELIRVISARDMSKKERKAYLTK
jgi:uncharacterized DUF497 family protein